MIPQSFIQDLLGRVDIVDVIERSLPLKKAGANYLACCPFHGEKTPSFTVSPTKQFYHCFGCGAHGSAIGFIMEYHGLGYVEAIRELAQQCGLVVPEERSEAGLKRREAEANLGGLLTQAADYYREQLKQSPAAIDYLKGRGLTGQIAARFGIGYAPPGWQNLAQVFPEYQSAALVTAGLVIAGDDDKRYDRFRDRVMFPITNARGAVIGFGGRVLGAGEPKYLNSPETPLFEKGRELYGLFQARDAIRHGNRVVVVEGYMDVVALAQYGVEYAVATLGTATTPVHVQKLLRQADRVIFCFDGDAAGRKAAWRALENSLEAVVDGKLLAFLFLPQGDDPDSYVRRVGREAFEAELDRALPLSEFLLRELSGRADLKSEEGRAALLQAARPLLAKIGAPTLALMLRRRLAELAGIGLDELDSLFGISRAKPVAPAAARPRGQRRAASAGLRLLAVLLYRPALAGEVDARLCRTGDDAELAALAALVEALRGGSGGGPLAHLLEQFRGGEHFAPLSQAAEAIVRLGYDDDFDLDAEFRDGQNQLLARLRERELDALQRKARAGGLDAEEKKRLLSLLAEK